MAGTVATALAALAAAFVAVNVGGSSTGVAFGPATGSGAVTKRAASVLMAGFVLLGSVTYGPRVTATLGHGFVPESSFTLAVATVVLFVTGLGVFIGNYRRVSVSTSETAVGAVVGLGAALGALQWATVWTVALWWVVAAIAAFWVAAVVGRYAYDDLAAALGRHGADGRRGRVALVAGGCGMAFAAGGSNVGNAVAALVSADVVAMGPAVAAGGLGIGVGAVLLGPRTMETVGEEITDLPVAAALVVEVVAASVITALNVASIPASLAVTTTMCVVGLGWGRASRRTDVEASGYDGVSDRSGPGAPVLYDPAVTRRIVTTWVVTPTVAAAFAFAVFGLAAGGLA